MKKTLLTFVTFLATMFVASAQTNLVENGDFETWADGQPVNWDSKPASTASSAVLQQSTDAHAGTYSVLVKGASGNKRIAYKDLTLKAGTYTMHFFAKAATAENASVRPGYVPFKADGTLDSQKFAYGEDVNNITNSTWVEVNHEFTLAENTRLNVLVMNPKKPGKDVLIDDFSLTTLDGGIANGGEVTPDPQPEPNVTVYSTIAELKKNAVKDAADVVFEFKELLVTGKAKNDIYVTDGTEAILFYSSANTLKAGDKISGKVKGSLVSFFGLSELKNVDYSEVKVVSSNNEVKPVVVTLAELAAEGSFAKYESMLVAVKGVKFEGTAFNNKNITMVDGADKVTLRDNYSSATDFAFDANASYDVEGVISQFKNKTQINLLSAEGIKVATGIETVETSEDAQVIYDLSGRRVAKPVKGLYIVNGKKVCVK